MASLDRNLILAVGAKFGARNIRVFGSTARGQDRPDSDLDLLLDLEEGRSLLDLIGFKQELEDLLGRPVDVVTERSLNRYLRDNVLAEAVPL